MREGERGKDSFFCIMYLRVCLCVSYALHSLLLVSCYAVHINALSIMKV